MGTFKTHLKTVFTPYELELLHYFYLCIAYEGSKFIVMLFFFRTLQLQNEFLTEIFVLLTLRNFYGGIHFKHYLSCFAFTFGFIATGLLLAHYFFLNNAAQIVILLLSLIISCIIKPVASSNRPPLSEKQEAVYHICGISILLLHIAFFISCKTFPYRNICFWLLFYIHCSLLLQKLLRKEENNEKTVNEYSDKYLCICTCLNSIFPI